ncbi:SPRY domain-containing SOCS box protein 3 [Chanos chanos]|uniref:SPRY domain-containing SOCS box protein 3 n=1 Tax=Chanos chanos TaxID=29144 RepID=A0A6J2UZF0_CHACN|nr:SPRY domain-containing SOCS box protein 3-like [Chanos chanos]
MSRRTRSGRCISTAITWEMELATHMTTYDPEDWTVQGSQSDSDSEEYQAVSLCVPAVIPMEVPVIGESFCRCPAQTEVSSPQVNAYTLDCLCGEEEQSYDWVWDEECKSTAAFLSCSNRKVNFHTEYSCGTAAIRGSKELGEGQHYWEIKMTSPVYGTDMMVGIGTREVNLDQYRHSFCSLLGTDGDSWGLSYTGLLHHKGSKVNFSSRFGQGSIIGVHLDTWHGTLTFYKNRRCIGVAATHLQKKRFYPMVCSTAAKSSMKVIRSCSSPTSLQYLCCLQLRRVLPHCADVLSELPLPPGLRMLLHNQLGWVLHLGCADAKADAYSDHADYADVCPSPAPSYPSPSSINPDPYHNSPSYPAPPGAGHAPYLDAGVYSDSDSCSDSAPCPCLDPPSYANPSVCPCCDASLSGCEANCSGAAPFPHGPAPSACQSPPTPTASDPTSESDSDSCASEPDTCQRKRCRWT